jgi:hypothetical protein
MYELAPAGIDGIPSVASMINPTEIIESFRMKFLFDIAKNYLEKNLSQILRLRITGWQIRLVSGCPAKVLNRHGLGIFTKFARRIDV